MPGFYGLITKNDSCHSNGNLFDIINNNLFMNQWSLKNNIHFMLDNAHVDLGVVSLNQKFTKLKLPENVPELYLEGYIYDISGLSSIPTDYFKLQNLLRELYIKDGHHFLNKIHGSFTMMIIDSDCISLVTDHTYSRPIYFFKSDNLFAWSPETFPLIIAFRKYLSLNIGNLGQILCSEFSFIDDTIVNEITCLRPGEILTYQNGEIKRKYYFRFRYDEKSFESGLFAGKKLAQKLNNRIREVIDKQWAMAPSPAIMLSGGLDSRYVVARIAEIVDDTSKLTLVTWSIPDAKIYSDLDISKRIAQRLGAKHIIVKKTPDGIIKDTRKIFQLIGCEVDSIFHVNEKCLMNELREKYGIESVFRGEQSFGWGEYRKNLKRALNQIIVSYPQDNPWLKKIFKPDVYHRMLELWHQRLGEILSEYHQKSVNDLKDNLYFNWRLARYLSTLSYFKMAHMEQFNPLLDPQILKLIMIIPSRLRIDKKLFRMAYNEHKRLFKGIPYATRNSLENWDYISFNDIEISDYLRTNHMSENKVFENSSTLLEDFFDEINDKLLDHSGLFSNILKFNPYIRQNLGFKMLNMIRHIFIKPPPETVLTYLIFRTAMVKDFLRNYYD
jgi:asparagine synthetase B (glutamine-hydrolysing)